MVCICVQTACVACGSGLTTLENGAKSSAACQCPKGTFWDRLALSCLECPFGVECSGGVMEVPRVMPGYWAAYPPDLNRLSLSDISVFACRTPSGCPGGSLNASMASTLPMCHPGAAGTNCYSCIQGYMGTSQGDGYCEQCREGSGGLLFSVIPMLLVASMLMYVFGNHSEEEKEHDPPRPGEECRHAEERVVERLVAQ